jgi:hypothetical protein
MEQNPSQESNSHVDGQDIPHVPESIGGLQCSQNLATEIFLKFLLKPLKETTYV